MANMRRTLPSTNLRFYFGRIRTLVAMATYSFHRLIMGKVKIGNFYCLIRDFTEMFIEGFTTFHKTFVGIAQFDWLLWYW